MYVDRDKIVSMDLAVDHHLPGTPLFQLTAMVHDLPNRSRSGALLVVHVYRFLLLLLFLFFARNKSSIILLKLQCCREFWAEFCFRFLQGTAEIIEFRGGLFEANF
jgi:hypothetical protein